MVTYRETGRLGKKMIDQLAGEPRTYHINREQQQVIEYLRTENEMLKEKLGKKRILLNDDQRRRLAVKGKVLGRKALCQVATVVSPDTILRWQGPLGRAG